MRTAYLLVCIDHQTPLPYVRHACIASQPASSMTVMPSKEVYASIYEMEGETFDDARQRVINLVKDRMPWLIKHLRGYNETI